MNISVPHSTQKCGLSATKQAARESGASKSFSGAKFFQQLSLVLDVPQKPAVIPLKKRQKPQISGIPGISPKDRHRYRVIIGNEILGDRLNVDEAIALANQSTL